MIYNIMFYISIIIGLLFLIAFVIVAMSDSEYKSKQEYNNKYTDNEVY